MVELMDLILPMLLSAVAVFVASSVIWMCLPIHKNDFRKLPDEDAIVDAVKGQNLSPGMYCYPYSFPEEGQDKEALAAKLKRGPWGMLSVVAAAPSMGKCLGLWMLHLLIVSLFVAYLCTRSHLGAGAEFMEVFRHAGTVSFLAHAAGAAPNSIWKGVPWSHAVGQFIDGAIYCVITGLIFAAMWPAS